MPVKPDVVFAVIVLLLTACAAQGQGEPGHHPLPVSQAAAQPVEASAGQVQLGAVSNATRICDGMTPTLHRSDKGHFLLACDCNCTSHDNVGWFVSSQLQQVQGLSLGRAATKASVRGADLIKDFASSHPFCAAPNDHDLERADFISLIKYPTGDEASPYCFQVRNIVYSDGEVQLVEGDESIDPSDADALIPGSAELNSKIIEIVRSHAPRIIRSGQDQD